MSPKQATQLYRTYAILTLKNMDLLAQNSEMTIEENKQIALTYMNLYAELLWSFADVLDSLAKKYNFDLEPLKALEAEKYDLSKPPFEEEFFNKKIDL